MYLSDIIHDMIAKFSDAGLQTPVLDAQVIVAHILEVERYKLIAENDCIISAEDERIVQRMMRRRLKGEPVAYIVGQKEFYSLSFAVTREVMIPRPETELLVDLTLFHARQRGIVLDLGTGSGAIAISVKHNRGDLDVYASDISKKALQVAKRNARNILGGDAIRFYQGDLFSPFQKIAFDIIVTNPPYVDPEKRTTLQDELLYEPAIALFAENRGQDIIKRIVLECGKYLSRHGMVIMEIGEEMEDFLGALISETDFHLSILSDYGGLPRVALIKE
jgi:release factor glutamine methyltransferase